MPEPTLPQLFETVEAARYFRDLAPDLNVGQRSDFTTKTAPEVPAGEGCGTRGYLTLPGVIDGARAAAMSRGIEALHGAGLPGIFAYVYDELWEPIAALDATARAELGDYDVLSDAWAFRVAPGARGWSAHRGWHEHEGERTMLNVWVALTHATQDTSCMFVVPLDRDPSYPGNLESIAVPEGAAVALPALPGTALVWDANVLHWGGEMSASATSPRMSITYTLRKSSRRRADLPFLDLRALDFRARLDLIAGELVKYGEKAGVTGALAEWARLTLLTRRMGTQPR